MGTTPTLTAQGHPTRKAVQGVIDTLKRGSPAGKVEMGLPYVFRDIEGDCGTVACHAGHFAAACLTRRGGEDGASASAYWCGERWGPGVRYPGDREMLYEGGLFRTPVSFHRGSDLLAQHLGFKTAGALEDWAQANPEIWGNRFGAQMFAAGPYAFAVDDEEAFRWLYGEPPASFGIGRVVEKWKRVLDYLPAEPDDAKAAEIRARWTMRFEAGGLFVYPYR